MLARLGIALTATSLVMIVGCSDPNDPQTWIKRLRNPKYATEAVKRLRDLKDPVAVKPLCDLYQEYESPNILKAIISFKHPDSVPTLIKALSFNEDNYHNATLAAAALAEMKATEAVAALIKVLEKPMSIRSRANLAKLSAINALMELESKEAVPALIEVAGAPPEHQDFLLAKRAMEALGAVGDPSAVSVLIRGLFASSTVQGSSFPQARVALVRIGEPAVEPLLKAMRGQDTELNEMAKQLSFGERVIVNKIARVLGDMRASTAVPALLKKLPQGRDVEEPGLAGVIEALGKIGDRRAIGPLVSLVRNARADAKLRIQVCSALTLIPGSAITLPVLLELAEKGYVNGNYTDLREAAVMAYSRIVGEDARDGVQKVKAMLEAEKLKGYKATIGVFGEALERVKLALECGDDVRCYAKTLGDTAATPVQREKSGIMIGLLPEGRVALDALVKALPDREPILRLFFLQSAIRIGKGSDTELVKTITDLEAKDSKRRAKFLGGDLASAERIALAVIKRK